MSGLHTQLGAIAVTVNAVAALIGGIAWLVRRNPKAFWILLRIGQGLIMVEAVIGATLSLTGHDLPRLHLVYGLTPIAVAFLAEQLRIMATPTLLDQRGLSGRRRRREAPRARAARVRGRDPAARDRGNGHVSGDRCAARGPRAGLALGAL